MNDTFILNVNKLYRNKTYLDKYGHSVFITVIVIIAFLLVFSYFYIKANLEPLKQDWDNVKCHPGVIPFAGMINKDPNDTVFQSTTKNFSVCTNLILKSIYIKCFTIQGHQNFYAEPIKISISTTTNPSPSHQSSKILRSNLTTLTSKQ